MSSHINIHQNTKHKSHTNKEKNLNTNFFNHKKEMSTRNTTKDNFLDYTFLSHRSDISSQKRKDTSKSNDYIFDLLNTWELNIDLMVEFAKSTLNSEQSNDLSAIIERIKKRLDEKKNLTKEISKTKGRILIEKQIIEELKRKIEENDEYYNDQIKEFEENRDGKEEYIKIFEKKLKEVEIYIQKNTKNVVNSKFEQYKDFKMNDFIEENTDLVKKRDDLNKELYDIQVQKMQIEKENANYEKDMNNLSFAGEDGEGHEQNNMNQSVQHTNQNQPKVKLNESSKAKLRQYYDNCKNQVKILEMRNQLLKNYFNQMSKKLKYFNCDECILNLLIFPFSEGIY